LSRKIQSFYVLKLESEKLKKHGYKIKIDLNEARKNNEVVSLANSQMIRTIQEVTKSSYSQEKLDRLIKRKKVLGNQKNKSIYRKELSDIQNEIDKLLFIPELIVIHFNHTSHYKTIIKKGLFINDKEYVRLMTGAGHARRNSSIFIKKNIWMNVNEIFENGRNKNVPLVYSKYNAYYGLYASATQPVSFPRIAVISDLELEFIRTFDFVEEVEQEDDLVYEKTMPVKQNIFDGMGLISIEFARQWRSDLELDYLPSGFIFRGGFFKGMLATFDIKMFAKENNSFEIKDVWGNIHNVKDIDIIATQSQFKLWMCYNSIDDYHENCIKNNIGFGVSRVSPKKQKDFFYSSYQYLQVLNEDKVNIEKLCEPTLNYFKDVSSDDANKAILYLLGDKDYQDLEKLFEQIDNNVLKALMINKNVIKDSHIKNHIFKTINKKIRNSFMGNLILDGCYQMNIADPVAFMQHALGLSVTGLLKDKEYYSKYWSSRKINKIATGRSPLTWRSELNVLNLIDNNDTEKWYKYLSDGIITNIYGDDNYRWADSDMDGDLIFSTSNEYLINGAFGGNPITYNRGSGNKDIINTDELYKSDIDSYGSRIGVLTNYSTTSYSMLSMFNNKDSEEYKTIINRLKITRKNQGQEIDKAKLGGFIKPIPEWAKYRHIKNSMTEEEKNKIRLHNRLLLDRRPLWMIYLYPHRMNEFRRFNKIYENYVQSKMGFSLETLLNKKDRNKKENDIYNSYVRYSPFIVEDKSIMMKIYKYMVQSVREHKLKMKNDSSIFNYAIYLNKSIPKNSYKLQQMENLLKEYKSTKKNLSVTNNFENKEQVFSILRNKAEFNISNNISELTNLAVNVCYEKGTVNSRQFVFDLFGDGVIQNLLTNNGNKIMIPVLTEPSGDLEFLGKHYSLKEVEINNVI
jgi:hypothetical protein